MYCFSFNLVINFNFYLFNYYIYLIIIYWIKIYFYILFYVLKIYVNKKYRVFFLYDVFNLVGKIKLIIIVCDECYDR